MTLPLVIAALLSQQPLPPNSQQLPPGHPPINGTTPMQAPPLPSGTQPGQPLPPNHPSLGATSSKPGGSAPTMEELIKKLDSQPDLATREKTFELAESIGRLYYGQGRFRDAAIYLEQAVKKAEPARALYQAQKKLVGATPLPTADSVGCGSDAQTTMEVLFKKAEEKVAAKSAPAATVCARAALEGVMETETLLGNAKYLQKDYAGAQAAYDHSLEAFDMNAEARYARGAMRLDSKGDDVKMLKLAQADFERFLADAPTSTRAGQARRMLERTRAAITAGGVSKLPISAGPMREHPVVANAPPMMGGPMQGGSAGRPLGGPMQGGMPGGPMQGGPMEGGPNGPGPNVAPEVMQAFQNAKVTPEMEAQFAKTLDEAEEHLAKGRYQQALDAYKQVMPFKPEPRVQAGMAWSLVRLGKPTADRIWFVASQNPDVVSELGDKLKAKGDEDGAKQLWKKLAETVPAYAPRLQGKM